MKKYCYPIGSDIMKSKPKNATWVTVRMTEQTLESELSKNGIELAEYILKLFFDLNLNDKGDRLELRVRKE
jgi:hypothetical protein